MDSKEIMEDNKIQKGMPEYDHYAKKSLLFAIIVLCLPFILGLLAELAARNNNRIIEDILFLVSFILIPLVVVVLAILGVVFGKKGLKSRKAVISIVGLALSGIELLLVLILVVYLLAGGQFM